MLIKQISVFVENKPGRLADVTGILADAEVNIHALSIADTTDFGILRMIVSDPDKAKETLKKNGLTVKTTDVIGVTLEHSPGSLYRVLRDMEDLKVNVEYMYAFTSRPIDHGAIVILRLSNQAESLEKLQNSSVRVLDSNFINTLNET